MRWTVQMSQKYMLPHLPKATSLADKHTLHKDNFATRNGELSKVITDIKTDASLLFPNKSKVKHATWSNSSTVVSDTLSQSCIQC